ncbi:MAG: serine O-acetyltransferase EpsC [Hyphomicrobiaceae bacterium]|nr:serine O-acetyltransferase EpsC [Hyphomicrobiaceae bacterium]
MSVKISGVVAALRATRDKPWSSKGQHALSSKLPSPPAIAGVVDKLSAALFPQHLGHGPGDADAIDYFIGHTLSTALAELEHQVRRELAFSREPSESTSPDAIAKSAAGVIGGFAEGLPDTLEVLKSDIRAAYDGDPSAKSLQEVLLSYPGIKAIIHHRLAHALFRLGVPIIARVIAERAHSETGIDIHPGAQIARSFFIDHGTGVVIGETAIIGERVRLYQAVTLGAKRFSVDDSGALVKGVPRHPIVEEDVVIYAGATILGRVTIGRGSVIGGNVWLTRSVPANSNIIQALARSETFDGGAGI